MKTQLKDRYLRGGTASQGLYLIGWFHRAAWEQTQPEKARAGWTLDQAKQFFHEQATKLSAESVRLRSFVLDARRLK